MADEVVRIDAPDPRDKGKKFAQIENVVIVYMPREKVHATYLKL